MRRCNNEKVYQFFRKTRDDYVRVDVSVPGERWEVEFAADGDIVIERFQSMGDVEGEEAIKYLFDNF